MPAKKVIAIAVSFLLFVTVASAKIYKVATKEEFLKAAALVKPGDEIVIVNGSYNSWDLEIDTKGKSGKPVVIRAETAGKVIFSGEVSKSIFRLTGSYTHLSGFIFSDCTQTKADGGNGILIELKATESCRVTNCQFTKITSKVQFVPILTISGNGKNNRVDHCSFSGNIDNQEVQVKVTANEIPLYSTIDNNNFSNKPKVSWANNNGGECVQIGQDPILLGNQYSYATVRDNRFIACDGEPEVISNKSSGNTYLNNYFENCHGELVMRGGHECKIEKNTFKSGSGGIRINGSEHIVTNNVLSDLPTGIRLMYGMSKGKVETGFYVAATNCIVKNNRISKTTTAILVGDSKNADWNGKFDTKRYPSRTMQDVPPSDNEITDNTITESKNTVVHNEQ